ncbi:MAG: hypothetical protein GY773_02855, partial [Actinomycetia bacterium]|nr:hypothetical protein [Actinomycetes bacterium]
MNGQRVGHRQLEVLRAQLSQRDLDLLEAIGTYRLLRGDQARRLHFADHATTDTAARVARRVLRRLNGLGLVARLHRRVGGVRAGSAGHIYTLTPLAHRLLGSPKRRRTNEPSYAFVHHTLAMAELATRLIEAERGNRFEVLQLQPEPDAWRHYMSDLVASTLKPDLFIRPADDDFELSWFSEIDCGTDSAPTIQRKCLA